MVIKIRLHFLMLYSLSIRLTSVEKFRLSPSQCFPSPVISHRIFQKGNSNVHTFAFWWLLALITLVLPQRWWRPRLQNHVNSISPANASKSLRTCLGVVCGLKSYLCLLGCLIPLVSWSSFVFCERTCWLVHLLCLLIASSTTFLWGQGCHQTGGLLDLLIFCLPWGWLPRLPRRY